MTKKDFFIELRNSLREMNGVEKDIYIKEYENSFEERLRIGELEEDIVFDLGSISDISKRLFEEYNAKRIDKRKKGAVVLFIFIVLMILVLGFELSFVLLSLPVFLYCIVFLVPTIATIGAVTYYTVDNIFLYNPVSTFLTSLGTAFIYIGCLLLLLPFYKRHIDDLLEKGYQVYIKFMLAAHK